jgi:hypothetical protein
MSEPRNNVIIGGAIVAAIVVAGGVYYYKQRFGVHPEVAPVSAPAAPAGPAPNRIQHPLPQDEARDEVLPPLEQSDAPARDWLAATFGNGILDFLVPENIVRNVVATVDNLPRNKLALRLSPLKATKGPFIAAGTEDAPTLSPDNYARYAPLVRLFQTTDTQKLVDTYVHFYPLLQSAYEDLGYPDRYFNDRIVEVIDHLLATPDVKSPIPLTQPKVLYEFADGNLEALSVGQKALLRMGPEQRQAMKGKLREFRAAISKPKG